MFSLEVSLARAEKRLAGSPLPTGRKTRCDRGHFRLAPEVRELLDTLLASQERPAMVGLMATLEKGCVALGKKAPSRATVYKYMARAPGICLPMAELPATVATTLYNLAADAMVPAHQVAFRALTEGEMDAVSFAASMPWLALYQARLLPGWRPRSRGLLDAICTVRRI